MPKETFPHFEILAAIKYATNKARNLLMSQGNAPGSDEALDYWSEIRAIEKLVKLLNDHHDTPIETD